MEAERAKDDMYKQMLALKENLDILQNEQ